MLLTPDKIQEILDIFDNFHVLFIANQVGTDILTPNDLAVLAKHGVDISNIVDVEGKVTDAFKFGLLAEALGNKAAKKLDYKSFLKFVESGKFLPLTDAEQNALRMLKFQAYNDIKGLSNRISQDFVQILIDSEKTQRVKYEKTIQDEAAQVVLMRETQNDLASRLGHKTQDWTRDFDRIADYVLHSAFDYGKAEQIFKTYGENAEVYKSVYKGACKHCIAAYLTDGLGSEPKIFKLKELLANGSNIGRKVADWLPVIGPHHPWCRCELCGKPENRLWNQQAQDFTTIVRNNYGVKRNSKVKVTITKE